MTTPSAGLSISSKSSRCRSLGTLLETSRRAPAWARCVAWFGVALLLLGAVCVPAQPQTLLGNWTQQSLATSPGARWQSTMAYDAAQGQVVLFGGFNETEIGDTWLWNGTTWTQQNPQTSPPARSQSAMAYDAAQSNVVLFGGYLSNTSPFRSNDTWVWNGTTWTQQIGWREQNDTGQNQSGKTDSDTVSVDDDANVAFGWLGLMTERAKPVL